MGILEEPSSERAKILPSAPGLSSGEPAGVKRGELGRVEPTESGAQLLLARRDGSNGSSATALLPRSGVMGCACSITEMLSSASSNLDVLFSWKASGAEVFSSPSCSGFPGGGKCGASLLDGSSCGERLPAWTTSIDSIRPAAAHDH